MQTLQALRSSALQWEGFTASRRRARLERCPLVRASPCPGRCCGFEVRRRSQDSLRTVIRNAAPSWDRHEKRAEPADSRRKPRTNSHSTDAPANVSGSVGFSPARNRAIKRVSPSDTPSPIPTRMRVMRKPWPRISRSTSCCCAPSAQRSPISCVRCAA